MGEGPTVGAALVTDPRADKVTFTGDVSTARNIVAASAANLPRLSLELGGKNPNIIFADADLDAATSGAVAGMFSVAGQDCGAGSRILIEREAYDEVSQMIADRARQRILGDPLDDTTEQGPQIDKKHLDRIDSYVRSATTEGAAVLLGGQTAPNGPLFYAPTVITEATPEMKISKEEIFGPVGALYAFDSFDEAIAIANGTSYGLVGAIWTRDNARAEKFVREMRSGTCWVNCYGYFDTTSPWGGRKNSGYGRELGRDGIDGYLETKAVFRAPL